ncbi:MAG TPA: endolytic transglycosylase MltG [Acidimicrobiales bacterium]
MTGPVDPVDLHGGAADSGARAPAGGDVAVPYETAPDGSTRRPGASTPAARKGHPWRIAALAVIVVGLVVLVGGYFWVQSEANPSGPPGPQVFVTVPAGAGVSSTGSLLAAKGVISNSFAFRVWTQFHSLPGVQAGPYMFSQHSSFDAVQKVLAAGPNVFSLVVPPGFTVSELADRVGQLPGHNSHTFLATATSGEVRSPWQPTGVTSLEGLLATGTYTMVPGETDRQLLAKMVDRFDALAAKVGLADGAARLGYTPYQVVTVASIVEKEGVLVKNMGPVARVVYNRLAKDTPLQMDSTVLYALGRDGGPVTSADLKTVSPYNTYLTKGLTPTPTCFPSEEALNAALNPPEGPWLYFVVVQSDGTEAFSTTYAGQLANEALAKQRGVG